MGSKTSACFDCLPRTLQFCYNRWALAAQSVSALEKIQHMTSFDFKKLNRTMTIYRVVQTLLLCLLIYVAEQICNDGHSGKVHV